MQMGEHACESGGWSDEQSAAMMSTCVLFHGAAVKVSSRGSPRRGTHGSEQSRGRTASRCRNDLTRTAARYNVRSVMPHRCQVAATHGYWPAWRCQAPRQRGPLSGGRSRRGLV